MDELQRLRTEYQQTFAEYERANEAMLRAAESQGSADDFHAASARVSKITQKLRTQRAALAACLRRSEADLLSMASLIRKNET